MIHQLRLHTHQAITQITLIMFSARSEEEYATPPKPPRPVEDEEYTNPPKPPRPVEDEEYTNPPKPSDQLKMTSTQIHQNLLVHRPKILLR